jgi:glycosyltransferase involved in cell wall biosynthesis
MNILWLSWKDIGHPDAGGAELYGQNHAETLVRNGHSVHWVSTSFNGSIKRIEKNGVTFERVGKKWMWYLGIIHLLFFFKYIFEWQKKYFVIIDEIHGPPLLVPLYSKQKVITVIHEVAGEIWKKTVPFPISAIMQYIVDPLFFKAYKKNPVITVSDSTKKDLIKTGIPADNIFIIHNSITPQKIHSQEKEKSPTLLFLSSLRPMKGFERVYDAFKKLQARIPDLHMWVVGDDSLQYAKDLKQKITAEQTEGTIIFFGRVTEQQKYDLLQRSHILVHGSYKEGWGRVVIEAGISGTPSVVFNAAGLTDSIQNGKTGYLANDEQEFIEDISTLLSNQELLQQFSDNAKNYAMQFTTDKIESQFISLFNSLTTGTK